MSYHYVTIGVRMCLTYWLEFMFTEEEKWPNIPHVILYLWSMLKTLFVVIIPVLKRI